MKYKKFFQSLPLLFLLTTCDWFEPGEAEKPWEEESKWLEPVSPSVVITNLQNSFENRNIINYTSSLSQDFMFFGDPSDSQYVPPGVFNDWTLEVEEEVATKIFNTFDSKIDLSFQDSLKDSTGSNANFYLTYNINLESSDSATTVMGISHFELVRDSVNLWSISNWRDYRLDTLCIDWGILKAMSR
jgi:hypothetical protein